MSPTIWPLVWLGFAALIMIDPLPILFKPSRYWLIRNVGKLLISGTRRVEVSSLYLSSVSEAVVEFYLSCSSSQISGWGERHKTNS